jgi:hypothetical protein
MVSSSTRRRAVKQMVEEGLGSEAAPGPLTEEMLGLRESDSTLCAQASQCSAKRAGIYASRLKYTLQSTNLTKQFLQHLFTIRGTLCKETRQIDIHRSFESVPRSRILLWRYLWMVNSS